MGRRGTWKVATSVLGPGLMSIGFGRMVLVGMLAAAMTPAVASAAGHAADGGVGCGVGAGPGVAVDDAASAFGGGAGSGCGGRLFSQAAPAATGQPDEAQAVPPDTGAPSGPAEDAPGGSRQDTETVFWQSVANSTNPAEFEAYLARWPEGVYAPLARIRLSALRDPLPVRRAGDVFRDCPTCPELVAIPAGYFMMGSPASEEGRFDDEGPQHQVTVGSFALGRYEVTRDEYRAFAEATGHSSSGCWIFDSDEGRAAGDVDASWREPGFAQGSGHPVVCVSWNDAQAYVRWLSRETGESYRLPSESEWEYAARGATTTRWHWGDAPSSQCGHANGADAAAKRSYSDFDEAAACDDGAMHTAVVGSYSVNTFGLFDMSGNVWEWVEDCWNQDYAGAPSDGTAWRSSDCGRRVLRGGSWIDPPPLLRSATRHRDATEGPSSFVGFRVARTLD